MSTIPGRCILGMVTAFVVIHANAGVALAAENKMHQVPSTWHIRMVC